MIDKITITVKGGDGGDGAVSFRREKFVPHGGPDGGDGGRGGDVYLEASSDVRDFEHLRFRKIYCGSNGERGKKSNKNGKNGEDLVIKVPMGSCGRRGSFEFDLKEDGQRVLVARGGAGGIGNTKYWNMKAKKTGGRPHGFWDRREMMKEAGLGEKGEGVRLILELKLIAEVGIIGLPNSGKSTLLSKLTRARPKIADYPFTTLEPNLGVFELEGKRRVVMADIPGLIEGAGGGKGLGFEFLKHIVRTRLLVHLLSLTEFEREPRETFERLIVDYKIVRKELESYNPELLKRKEIVVLNKIDLAEKGFVKTLLSYFSKKKVKVLGVSAKEGIGLEGLMNVIIKE